jgi:hypothetical protein
MRRANVSARAGAIGIARCASARNIGNVAAVIFAAAILGAGDVPLTLSANRDSRDPAANIADAPPAPDAPSIQSGAGLTACLAWTDGCTVCRRDGAALSCSNPGIACQPQAPKCLAPATPERKPGDAPDGR